MPYPPAHSSASSISLPAISADATRWSGAAVRCGAAQGCTQAVSASTTRATRLARSRQCALRSGAQQGQLVLTACDRHRTRRVGRTMRSGVGLSYWAIARGGDPPPKARKSYAGCTSTLGCGAIDGTVARALWERRATGGTPTVRGALSTSRRGRCVTHWRSDGTTPPGAGAPGRERVLLGCSKGEINGEGRLRSRERSFPGHDAQAEHVRVLPLGPLRPPAARGSRVEPRGARAGRKKGS